MYGTEHFDHTIRDGLKNVWSRSLSRREHGGFGGIKIIEHAGQKLPHDGIRGDQQLVWGILQKLNLDIPPVVA